MLLEFIHTHTHPENLRINYLSSYLYFSGERRKKDALMGQKLFFFLIFKKIFYFYLFIYFWLRWVFVAACGLSLVAVSGGYSSLRCAGFSLQWLLLLRSTGSRRAGFSSVARRLSSCGSRALERRLSSCGAWAQLLCGMWDLPRPGLEPVSPALAGDS